MNVKAANNFIKTRTKLLKELRQLTFERSKITNQIRVIQREMTGWDNYLLQDEKEKSQ